MTEIMEQRDRERERRAFNCCREAGGVLQTGREFGGSNKMKIKNFMDDGKP